jgi:UDP-N-acetylglucosamine transferase subunit ALG13
VIFVTVGTWRSGFDRLVKAIDDLVAGGIITDDVVAQVGHGSYQPAHVEALGFCSPCEIDAYIRKAQVVISHAGMGTIIQTLECGKPLVVVPRKPEFGEVDNDHQFSTAKQLEAEGKVLVAYEATDLPERLKEARDFVPGAIDTSNKIVAAVEEFVTACAERKTCRLERRRTWLSRVWPYRILPREDDDITADLRDIIEHFADQDRLFDVAVFIPNAGAYLSERFRPLVNGTVDIRFVTVRRASTVSEPGPVKAFIFRHRVLSNIMRHVEVLARRIKYALRAKQKMVVDFDLDFDPQGKRVLVIDDSVDTGTTMRMVKQMLRERGATAVATACISNHLVPEKVLVDYAVYRYRLLRTKNSRDYHAG